MAHRSLFALAVVVVAASTIGAAARPAQAPATDAWTALTAKLEAAALAGRDDVVKSARVECLRLLASGPAADRVPLIRYTIAYAEYRLAFVPSVQPQEQASMLDDADVQLKEAIKLNPSFAEAYGLLSSVYGSKIAKTPDLGMTLGPQSSATLGQAFALEPRNPRLLVFRGQSQFNTPPEFGGSIKAAEASFRQALALFEAEAPNKPWPNWGRYDAHVGLGRALADRGDKAGARAEYEKALVIAPDSSWVRNVLLPAVK